MPLAGTFGLNSCMMELSPGMAFRCMEPPRHVYVPLFDTNPDSDEMLLVNFTTLRESSIDDRCILVPLDYQELTHETTVAYSRAIVGKKSAFIRAVEAGHFIQLDDLPLATWRKIVEGAHKSEELPRTKKRLLPSV